MSSTMCFTSKGHSTRIAPPFLEKSAGDTKRFGLKILFAGLLFVLLFGLFAVPVAGETTMVEVSTFGELQSAISSANGDTTIIIKADITASEPLVLYSGQSITLMSDAEADRKISWASAPTSIGNGWVQVAGNLIVSGNDSGVVTTTLTLEGSISEDNSNSLVIVVNYGSFILNDGGILENNYIQAEYMSNCGAGVLISSGKFTMNGGEIRNCHAKEDGGGVYQSYSQDPEYPCSFEMTGGIISENHADGSNGGGGVYIADGIFTMSGGEISENSAKYYGGGIYLAGGSASLSGSASVTENSAEMNGGIWVNTDTTFSLTGNAKISGNTAISYHDASEIMTNAAVIQIAGSPTVGPNGVHLGSVTDSENVIHPSYILVTGDVSNVKIENINGYAEGDKLVRWSGEKPNGISSETFILSVTTDTLVEDTENKALVVTYNQNPTLFTLSFNPNDGIGSITRVTVPVGEFYTLPECIFTAPEGKMFKAWEIESTEYAPRTSYQPTASVVVWAVWVESDCQHTTAVNVDITYNGITKDFPQDAGDGITHYWYVNKVCDDCETVLESNVQSTAVHNANTLEKNGVCECNYHTITAGLSKTMYAVEDTNTYLAPEASDGYHGGSIDKDEEVTVLAEGLGVDGSWSLIQYSVTGTSREKVRFVKSESLVANDDEVVVTIFYPTDDYVHLSNEKLEIHWIASKNDVEKYEVDVFLESDTKSLIYHKEIQGVDGNYNYECELSEELLSTLLGTKSYKIVVTALSSTGLILGENTVSFKVKHPLNLPDDTWGFGNFLNSFKPFLNIGTSSNGNDTYSVTWDDFSSVCGSDHISRAVYGGMRWWGGSCAAMVSSVIAVNNNLFPMDGFSKGSKTYTSLSEITASEMFATHDLFPTSAENIGHYLLQLQIYQKSLPVQEKYYNNGFDSYDDIISCIERDEPVLIAMCQKPSTSGIKEAYGSHAILGYDMDVDDLGSGYDVVRINVYDPNYPFETPYLELYRQNGKVISWHHSKNAESSQYFESKYHRLGYLSEEDIIQVYFDNYLGLDEFKFKHQDELIYSVEAIDDTQTTLRLISRNEDIREIILLYDDMGNSAFGNLYRIPKEELQLVSTEGGSALIIDDHSSVELTLDAGTTASVIVDDTKESSVEITSDDENTNHEFTVTYGYDSTADKGYQEATVKGTMSDSFKGEATENGLKLTGLDSAEILVENDKGESVSVGTIQDADEYEDIVIDIDTSVKVTGNKDGVSEVLVSVPLNKVQYESSSSYKDTGSGNYAEYPRTVTNGGYVDFGTSPVVKGVTVPKGVNGKVVLIAKSKTSAPEGKEAYGVFEINVDSYPIWEKAVISFTIPLSDLQKKGFTEKDICLYHFDGEVWTKLPTTYTVEGDKVFYEAETTAFSPFAIIYEKDGATSAAVSEIPVEPENPSDEPVSTVPEIPSSSEPQETESPAPVLGMMLGGLGAAVLMRRK